MRESLLRQAPNGAVGPGLTTLATPSATKLVFTLKPGGTFWDGKPVTPADVYSLDRNTNPKLGGFYGASFDRVKSIKATGSRQVTITLKQPGYRLQGELASVEAVILEKAYVKKEGKKFGTPTGGTMCTGAYKFAARASSTRSTRAQHSCRAGSPTWARSATRSPSGSRTSSRRASSS
jgi:peptide/nickel transport system substrate-binding protein